MLFLITDALLLFLITTSIGIFMHIGLERFFRTPVRSDLLGVFLTGLIISTIYFNLLSFWLPVNYLSILPLAAVSLFVSFRYKDRYRQLWSPVSTEWKSQKAHRLPFICLLILLGIYLVKPPTNPDSVGYHYLSILWYEKYRVIPGLANLHGRFAFNPASFIIQSAWSFTSLTGQSIYPLNGVITGLFLLWLLARGFRQHTPPARFLYVLLFFIFSRLLLGNMASPASDPLVQVCLSYALISLTGLLLSRQITLSTVIVPLLILLYAPVTKISAYPAIGILILVVCLIPGTGRHNKRRMLAALSVIGLLVYLPWIVRNYIMSGYLVYPFPFTGFFRPDWKVPGYLIRDYYDHIRFGPKALYGVTDPARLNDITFRQWVVPWALELIKNNAIMEIIALAGAVLSPLLWLYLYLRKERPEKFLFLFWLTLYISDWLWLVGSPDFRFGLVILIITSAIPLFRWTQDKTYGDKAFSKFLPVLFILFTLYYLYGAYHAFSNYTVTPGNSINWRKNLLIPLKNSSYTTVDGDSFPYKILGTGVKLYLGDSTHFCLNADLPCLYETSTDIEMRGSRIEDGFRPVK